MTTKSWAIRQILIMTIMDVSLFGCVSYTPTPIVTLSVEEMDKSPFTGIPCAAPCWQGLEVGKSSESDVMAVLPNLTFINQETVQTFQVSMPNIDFSASAPGVLVEASCANSVQQCLSIAVIENILTKIIVGINYDIKVDEAIAYLGNPDYIGESPIGGEYYICEVYLVWKDEGLALVSTFEAQESIEAVKKYCNVVFKTGKVPSGMLIPEARYLSDAELGALMSPEGSNTFFEFNGTIQEQ